VLTVAYSLTNPLYESTDELRHFRYVRHIAVYHNLPVQQPGAPRAQSHHPPLYYALGALVSWWVPVEQEVYYEPIGNAFWAYRYWERGNDNKNLYLHGDDERFPFHGIALAVYVVRWMTVLIGAGVVYLTYRTGQEIFGRATEAADWRSALPLGGAALVALNPQFLYLSGAVNNDVPAALCGAAVLWACVRTLRQGPSLRSDVTLGVLFGLALLTKFSLLALLALVELTCLVAAWLACGKLKRKCFRWAFWRSLLRSTLIVVGLAVLISGWWFWRNQVLYGEPTGFQRVTELWGVRNPAETWSILGMEIPMAWSTLWGRFGYGQVPMPDGVYRGLAWLAAAGGVGLTILVYRTALRRRRSQSQPAVPDSELRTLSSQLLILLVTVLLFAAVLCAYILVSPAGAMGRFFFPALPAFALLVFLGLSQFLPHRLTWAAALIVPLGMAALAIYALVGVLAPAFAHPQPLTGSEIAAVPNPTEVEFGDLVRLLGYQVTPSAARPGDVVEVTLYWQALARAEQNYAIFVHLLSEVGTMAAQRDTYPGLGRYPTTAWEPGTVFADTYRLHVPETAYAPDEGYIQVGLYLPDGPRLFTADGRDAVRLTTVDIQPQPGELPNPINVNFGNQVALVGYTMDRRVVHPGETIHLTLYWRGLVPLEKNYRAFAHVLGVEDQVWANSDSPPDDGTAPTKQWEPGQVVADRRKLIIGLTTPPNFYDVEVGMYRLGGDRLLVLAEDGHGRGDQVLLGKIRVVSDE
jgi:4-amino-4-deoxy-L-arabinose transferase-like glycosyltransferase